jgi:hypothetical protein
MYQIVPQLPLKVVALLEQINMYREICNEIPDGASTYTFPIGHASQNAQGFTIGVTGANNSTIKGFLETNIQTLVQSIAYCDIEKHSGTAGVENAGEGLSGYDGILDRITFNLKSPLQWDVVNPSGGITSYDITVSANGGQDITP